MNIYYVHNIDSNNVKFVEEITKQGEYTIAIGDRLAAVTKRLHDKTKSAQPKDKGVLNETSVKLPRLECDKFDGMSEDKMAFKNFLQQFTNCIEACGQLSKASKLTYLRSYLTGYAFRVISHLSISDDNYDIAISLLKNEFLDVEYIIDETFKLLLSKSPKFDPSFAEVKCYINDCRSMIYELKTYGVNLLEDDSVVVSF